MNLPFIETRIIANSLAALFLINLVGKAAMANEALAHWIYGAKNSETVVLIHGFNSSAKTWNPVLEKLAKNYRVVVYDQPGHGESKAAEKDYSPQFMANQLKQLMDTLKIEQAHIVGHSMGGRTALMFGFLFPEYAKSILVEDMSANLIPDAVAALPNALDKYDAVKNGVPRKFENLGQAISVLSQFYTNEEIAWILGSSQKLGDGSIMLGNRPEVTALYLYQGLALDMTEALLGITQPLVFFAADPKTGTAFLTQKGIAHIKSVRPDVPVRVFPDAPHSIHTRPEFLDALLDFIQR